VAGFACHREGAGAGFFFLTEDNYLEIPDSMLRIAPE
jgi:hypothetical protein